MMMRIEGLHPIVTCEQVCWMTQYIFEDGDSNVYVLQCGSQQEGMRWKKCTWITNGKLRRSGACEIEVEWLENSLLLLVPVKNYTRPNFHTRLILLILAFGSFFASEHWNKYFFALLNNIHLDVVYLFMAIDDFVFKVRKKQFLWLLGSQPSVNEACCIQSLNIVSQTPS